MISRLSQIWFPVVITSIPSSNKSSARAPRDAKTGGRILSVRDHQIDGVVFNQAGQAVFDDVPSRPPKNVADKKNIHEGRVISMVTRGKAVVGLRSSVVNY